MDSPGAARSPQELLEQIAQGQRALLEKLDALAPVPNRSAVILSYPQTGVRRAMPAGQSIIRLKTGQVQRPDTLLEEMTTRLSQHDIEEALSGVLWIDSYASLEARHKGQTTGKFFAEQGNVVELHDLPMDELVIHADYAYELSALFSTARVPPLSVQNPVSSQERYGEQTTVDAFAAASLSPVAGGLLAVGYRQTDIYVGHLGAKVYLISNTGTASADVNLQILNVAGKTWADSVITGASLTVASGDTARIEDGTACQFVRLRVRSTTVGSPTTLQIQYRGFSGVR